MPRTLEDFAPQCVDAAGQNSGYCPTASASLSSSNPSADIVQRMSNSVGDLTTKSYTDLLVTTGQPASLFKLATPIRTGLT